jgi:hypothetical protein
LGIRSDIGRAMPGLLAAAFVICAAGFTLAQPMSEQQIRCLQLQRELASAPTGGGGVPSADLAAIQTQIAQLQRVYDGTRASMEDAGCFEGFFIFGKGLVRSPKCISMNNRMEDARRQLQQLQEQRNAAGGGSRRRQAELQDALARNGCGGAMPPQQRSRGGLFDWFGGGREEEIVPEQPDMPISRSIDPNGVYRSICVRLCDGFFYPISYSTYASRLSQDATECQSNCAAPAELYVYRNPGASPEQAISLNGSAYADLPVAFRYKKEYVKGCSCKQAEYNPTEIETYNKSAEATAATAPVKGKPAKKGAAPVPAPQTAAPPPQAAPDQAAAPTGEAAPPAQLDLDVTGSGAPAAPAAEPQAEAAPVPVSPEVPVAPPPQAQQSTITKSKTPPPPPQ